MKLNLPNPSCRFDASKNRIRFWGYDEVAWVSFFVGGDALKKRFPGMNNAEAGFLKAFGAARQRIHEVAEAVHARGENGSYAWGGSIRFPENSSSLRDT